MNIGLNLHDTRSVRNEAVGISCVVTDWDGIPVAMRHGCESGQFQQTRSPLGSVETNSSAKSAIIAAEMACECLTDSCIKSAAMAAAMSFIRCELFELLESVQL